MKKVEVGDIVDGWVTGARRVPSPNCDARPAGGAIDLVVIHAISLPPDEFGGSAVEELFTNSLDCTVHPYYERLRDLRVSAHFFIRRDGELLQFVPVHARAWHAGASCWQGRERCNDFSLGIELEGCDSRPFEDCQYDRLAGLLALLRKACGVAAMAGHADIAPGRKTDPGPHFDWERLQAALAARTVCLTKAI
ncbi:1,6-anhydro-N-acetylmuramyl-L-alanine amidase AmpD [Pseudothauera lacus]|uniref:1,6-anhydro-N-acetylmuramyl-L-alanine amidase AmpD n=1 Tax=Pseudothauera lacus TaxID=2136175 RepID=A0A2T4IFS6_9RHOO|nr:1,6-anhydro-N-acetylmuramyl-L-alanine amidase AmpD [Pseudothauera lacus]PTD96607.1 1,6-anhydro-N-acetylmuramyl-L-alanine amidase AmpD [Pseudothauera lacus]